MISKPGELAWFARLINGGIDGNDHINAKAKLTEDAYLHSADKLSLLSQR